MATLFILDRERRSRRALYSLLATRFRVVAVHGIVAALRLLHRHQPDLVLVKTSGMDAFAMAVLKWFRQQGLRVPTIVLVGHGAGHDVNAVRQLGARTVLRWPVDNAELLRAVAVAGNPAGGNGTARNVTRRLAALRPATDTGAMDGGNGHTVRTWRPAPRIRPSVLRRA
jgi:DNA-binding NtrC family response regulator